MDVFTEPDRSGAKLCRTRFLIRSTDSKPRDVIQSITPARLRRDSSL